MLVDSRIKQETRVLDFHDTLNALNCQVTVGSPDCGLKDFKLVSETHVEEQPDDLGISTFKSWVTATGGKTI